jgi:hypothetical protein
MAWTLAAILMVVALLATLTGVQAFWQGRGSVAGSDGESATVDSELRFYSVYWLAYGMTCAWVALDLNERVHVVPALAAVLFASGAGRLLSLVRVGRPETTYISYLLAELIVPVLMVASYFAVTA